MCIMCVLRLEWKIHASIFSCDVVKLGCGRSSGLISQAVPLISPHKEQSYACAVSEIYFPTLSPLSDSGPVLIRPKRISTKRVMGEMQIRTAALPSRYRHDFIPLTRIRFSPSKRQNDGEERWMCVKHGPTQRNTMQTLNGMRRTCDVACMVALLQFLRTVFASVLLFIGEMKCSHCVSAGGELCSNNVATHALSSHNPPSPNLCYTVLALLLLAQLL